MTAAPPPAPLTPADCDITDFGFMPVDIQRVLDSDLMLTSTGDDFKAAFRLWCKSWHQVPAASLPANEQSLALLAGARNWRRTRPMAMRGWLLCSDGRYYHPVVAVKALEAWVEKLVQRRKSGLANAAQYRRPFDPSGLEASILLAMRMLREQDPQSRILQRRMEFMRKPKPAAPVAPAPGASLPLPLPDADHDGVPEAVHDGPLEALQMASVIRSQETGTETGVVSPTDTCHQSIPARAGDTAGARALPVDNSPTARQAGQVASALRALGIADANPDDPQLRLLLATGVGVEAFRAAAAKALGKAHPWPWLLAKLGGQLQDAAAAPLPASTAGPYVPTQWWDTAEGVKAYGAAHGKPYSRDGLGTSWTSDDELAHWRRYRADVFQLAGDGPWQAAR